MELLWDPGEPYEVRLAEFSVRPMLTAGGYRDADDEELTGQWPGWLAAGTAPQPGGHPAKAGA